MSKNRKQNKPPHRPKPQTRKPAKGSFSSAVLSFFSSDGEMDELLEWHRKALVERRWLEWNALVDSL